MQGSSVRQTPAGGQGLDRSTGGGGGTAGGAAKRAKSMRAAGRQNLKRRLHRSESFSGESSGEREEESDKAIRGGMDKQVGENNHVCHGP